MNRFKLIFIFLIQSTFLTANADSLFTVANSESVDSIRIPLYFQVARSSYSRNLDLSKQAIDSLDKLITSDYPAFYVSKLSLYQGLYFRFISDNLKSIQFLEKSISDLGEVKDSMSITGAYLNLGIVHTELGEYERAIEYYLTCARINQHNKDYVGEASTYNSIGTLYKRMGLYENAMQYLNKAVSILKEHGPESELAMVYSNIAGVIGAMKGDLDSAIVFVKKALEIDKKLNLTLGIGFDHLQLANLYTDQKKYKQAILHANEAIKYTSLAGNVKQKGYALIAKGSAENLMKSYAECIETTKKAFELFNKTDAKESILEVYQTFSEAYSGIGDYKKAFKFKNLYSSMKDSLIKSENTKIIKSLTLQFETAEKDKIIAEQSLEISQKSLQRNYYGFGFLLFSLLSFFGLYYNRNKQRGQKEKIKRLEKEQKLLAIDYLVQGQEEERKRIAQDLHDGLGGLLSTAQRYIQNMQVEMTKLDNLNMIDKTENLIENACNEVRRIAHDMMPSALLNLGLKSAIEDLSEQVNVSSGLFVSANIFIDESTLDSNISNNLYRIIQEAINNSTKYANAQKIEIELTESSDAIQLIINDDGIGMDPNLISQEGLGLKGIKSRVEYLNGQVEILSNPNEGVKFDIIIPK